MSERSPRVLLKRDIRTATTAHLEERLARIKVMLEHELEFVRTTGRRALVAERRDINSELLDRFVSAREARP